MYSVAQRLSFLKSDFCESVLAAYSNLCTTVLHNLQRNQRVPLFVPSLRGSSPSHMLQMWLPRLAWQESFAAWSVGGTRGLSTTNATKGMMDKEELLSAAGVRGDVCSLPCATACSWTRS